MRNLKSRISIIFILILVVQIVGTTNSKYATSFVKEGQGIIAEPIVEMESFDSIKKEVNKLDFPMEYIFKVKNYKGNKINEVDFLYNIEVIFSNNDFPIKYKIVDILADEIIDKTDTVFKLSKSKKEEKIYKIIMEWKDKDTELSEDFDMKININLKQYKIGEN